MTFIDYLDQGLCPWIIPSTVYVNQLMSLYLNDTIWLLGSAAGSVDDPIRF